MRTDFSPTLDNIDIGLTQLTNLIERYPDAEYLWLCVDRLEAEREKLISRTERLAVISARSDTMKPSCISEAELIRLAKIARNEGICVEVRQGDITIKLYPTDAKNAEEAELGLLPGSAPPDEDR